MSTQTKSSKDIRKEYVEKVQQARKQQQHDLLLNNCSEADRESVKLLNQLDNVSGGQLDRLVAVYKSIKEKNI